MAYSWEEPSWESRLNVDAAGDSDADDFDYKNLDSAESGQCLFELIISLKLSGKITAKARFCIVFFCSTGKVRWPYWEIKPAA